MVNLTQARIRIRLVDQGIQLFDRFPHRHLNLRTRTVLDANVDIKRNSLFRVLFLKRKEGRIFEYLIFGNRRD